MWDKILEEIEIKKKKCLDIVRVEIDPMEIAIHREQYKGLRMAEDIIRKHMDDGWIPVEKELPPFGKRLQATILHHEWISDYDASWVPEEEKTFHPAYTEVCEIYPMGAMWGYTCAEDDYRSDIAYIAPLKDISRPVVEITAWRPFLEAYKAERNGDSADA